MYTVHERYPSFSDVLLLWFLLYHNNITSGFYFLIVFLQPLHRPVSEEQQTVVPP